MLASTRSAALPSALTLDLELVGRVRSGDGQAREALVRTHVAAMLATAGRILGAHEHQASAAVRDAFGWALESLEQYDGAQPLSQWLHRAVVRAAVAVPIIASGGAGAVEHFAPAVDAGADAVLAASVFHFGELTIPQVKAAMSSAGITVR